MPDAARIEREDVLLFLNCCLAATGQATFVHGAHAQQFGTAFVHAYMLHGYRRLYALCLAAGINAYNAAEIVFQLLRAPRAGTEVHARHPLENALITHALREMSPARVYRLFARLRAARVNNRRTRAVIKGYLASRDLAFDALKYRRHVKSTLKHVHHPAPGELGPFLFQSPHGRTFDTPLFEAWRAAHFSERAVYELPYTVAEGFAAKHRIPRERFLARIEPRMTDAERGRLARTRAAHAKAPAAQLSASALSGLPLERLWATILALPLKAREAQQDVLRAALARAARRALGRLTGEARAQLEALGRTALVIDNSYSARGVRQTRHRSLAVALGVFTLLDTALPDVRVALSHPLHASDPLFAHAHGDTALARPLLDVMRGTPRMPESVLIVSDGWENAPAGGVHAVLHAARTRLGFRGFALHINPVFDPVDFAPRALSTGLTTVGARASSDVVTALFFARFAQGLDTPEGLEHTLERGALAWLAEHDADGGAHG